MNGSIIKLIKTIGSLGLNHLLGAQKIRREGRARNEIKRDEVLIIAQAQKEANQILSGEAEAIFSKDGKVKLISNTSTNIDDRS